MPRLHKYLLLSYTLSTSIISGLAYAQNPNLPHPDTVASSQLKLMEGFPPPVQKIVTLPTILKYPNARWAFHHLRELGPTARIWRGQSAPSQLSNAHVSLDSVSFQSSTGQTFNLLDWQKTTYTDALLILHRGKVVYEYDAIDMGRSTPHVLWSLSKSFTGLLATEMIQEGLIDPNATISHYLPELSDSAWSDATVQQTLDMTTAVRYRENFADPTAEIFRYLIAAGLVLAPGTYDGPRAVPDFLKTLHKEGTHGSAFQYKTVDTEVIGWLLQRVTGKSYAKLLSERIWSPMQAEEDGYVWVDGIGTQITSIGVSATLRDLGRFGEMIRQRGYFNGHQVLRTRSIDELFRGADREKFKAAGMNSRSGYSYHNFWWVPHDPDGTLEAKGLNGQHIHINPKAEMVIVKFSSHPVANTLFTHELDRLAFSAIAKALMNSDQPQSRTHDGIWFTALPINPNWTLH